MEGPVNSSGISIMRSSPISFTLAKALGGGFPIRHCVQRYVASAFSPGDHGSTFGGNPLACNTGYAVLSTIINDGLVKMPPRWEDFFERINALKEKIPVLEVRGKGLMIGIQFNKPIAKELNQMLFARKYLLGTVGDNILRVLPPLIITRKDIDGFISVLEELLCEF